MYVRSFYTKRRPAPLSTSDKRDHPLVGDRSGAAGPVSLTGRSWTVTLDPRNNSPLRSSLSEFPLEGLADGGSEVLTIALKEAVLEGVSLPPAAVPFRYSSSLSLTLVRMCGNVRGVLGGWMNVLRCERVEVGNEVVISLNCLAVVGNGGTPGPNPMVEV